MDPNVKTTLGSVLVGGLLSGVLTGVVFMQALIYFQLYPVDKPRIKAMVVLVWVLDALHTAMVFASNWIYLMQHFGNRSISDTIPWTMGITVFFTAFITFLVHCFFVQRVYMLSKYNWYITIPLLVLACVRIGAAMVSTIKMISGRTFSGFAQHYGWVFTLGLSASSVLDLLICCALLYYLGKSRTGFSSMDQVINSLSLYSIESGLVPCMVTVSALICWLTMQNNLVFLGLHFIISKLYANSLLATLNARARIRARSVRSAEDHPVPMPLFIHTSQRGQMGITTDLTDTKLQINVERDIHYEIEGPDRSSYDTEMAKDVDAGSDNIKMESIKMAQLRHAEHRIAYSDASPTLESSPTVINT